MQCAFINYTSALDFVQRSLPKKIVVDHPMCLLAWRKDCFSVITHHNEHKIPSHPNRCRRNLKYNSFSLLILRMLYWLAVSHPDGILQYTDGVILTQSMSKESGFDE